jgi:hypothetical protein
LAKGKGHFYNKLRKMLSEGVTPIYRKVVTNLSSKEAFQLETFFIHALGRLDLGEGCLCNHTDGGKTDASKVVKQPQRNYYLQVQLGKPRSAEVRKKISDSLRGLKRPPEFGKRLSEISQTNPRKIEHLRHMQEARKQPIEAINPATGEVVLTFESRRAAGLAGHHEWSISQCLHGQKDKYKGLVWKRLPAAVA